MGVRSRSSADGSSGSSGRAVVKGDIISIGGARTRMSPLSPMSNLKHY